MNRQILGNRTFRITAKGRALLNGVPSSIVQVGNVAVLQREGISASQSLLLRENNQMLVSLTDLSNLEKTSIIAQYGEISHSKSDYRRVIFKARHLKIVAKRFPNLLCRQCERKITENGNPVVDPKEPEGYLRIVSKGKRHYCLSCAIQKLIIDPEES